jgi:hypothetical protein
MTDRRGLRATWKVAVGTAETVICRFALAPSRADDLEQAIKPLGMTLNSALSD